MTSYLLTLAVTLVMELPIAYALAPRGLRTPILAVSLCANLVTHSLAAMLLLFSPEAWVAAEAIASACEALAFRLVGRLSVARSIAIAFVANLATLLVAAAFWQ